MRDLPPLGGGLLVAAATLLPACVIGCIIVTDQNAP